MIERFPQPTPDQILHLSASSISDYLVCPIRWYGSRIGKWPQQQAAAPQIGNAIHRGLTAYHRGQDDEIELLTAWKECVTAADVPMGSLERALAAQALYRSMMKPLPIDVADWWFQFMITGIPVPFVGALDLVRAGAQKPDEGACWDWKTGKGTNWGQQKADTEIQATAYWDAYTREAEYPPAKFVYVVIQTSFGTPWIKPITTYRTAQDVEQFEDLCRDVYRRMLTDPVIPTCPQASWCRFPGQCNRWKEKNGVAELMISVEKAASSRRTEAGSGRREEAQMPDCTGSGPLFVMARRTTVKQPT